MKKYLSIFFITALALTFAACDDDNEAVRVTYGDVEVQSGNVSEGESVNSTLTTITLTYNAVVSVSSNANVTLNGSAVTAARADDDATAVNITVSLASGTSYTLVVPEGAVYATNDKSRVAPEYTLNFYTPATDETITPSIGATALEVTQKLGFGWNLGNHFESYNENDDGSYSSTVALWGVYWDNATPTQSLYTSLAAAGVSTVRIPVTWGVWQGDAPSYTIDADYMATIRQNVEWARDAGLNVILNTHHDEYWLDLYTAALNSSVNEDIEDRITVTWTQIAEEFKDEDDYLFFETFNEVHALDNWTSGTDAQNAVLNEWNQVAVDAIRATGGNNDSRWIIVSGYAASVSATVASLELPDDDAGKIIVGVHSYDPYSFTLADTPDETWGHVSGNSTDESDVTDMFALLKSTYLDNDIPCYLGEFGCSKHTTDLGEQCRAYYLEYFCRAAYMYGLSLMIWDNFVSGSGSECHAYFSHNSGSWMEDSEELVTTMIKAATSDDASYTLESIYEKAP